jgi:glycosyltransferase involved in cell wall biosynthesis
MMLSVIIPVFNGERTLSDCLAALFASRGVDFEVIVVDDGSRDGSADIARQFPCRVITLGQNQGAARAKNIGAAQARGDVVVFTDADCLVQPDTLAMIAEDLRDPEITGVVGMLDERLRYSNFSSQYKNLWMHYTYLRLPRFVGVFYTSLAAARRTAFLDLGGFDSNYRGASVTEDIELGQRFLGAGHKILSDKRLTVEHVKRYDLGELLQTDFQRASALTKIFLRRRFDPRQRGQRYYASVPWYFILGVPLSYLAIGLAVAALVWALAMPLALASTAAVLALNAPFLLFLGRRRGPLFFIQSCLFLIPDMLASGLGVMHALITFARGQRY